MRWIRTESGRLVNLALHADIDIMTHRVRVGDEHQERYRVLAFEPVQPDGTQDTVTLCERSSRKAADEELNALFLFLTSAESRIDFRPIFLEETK